MTESYEYGELEEFNQSLRPSDKDAQEDVSETGNAEHVRLRHVSVRVGRAAIISGRPVTVRLGEGHDFFDSVRESSMEFLRD